ncbi:hypothetical protein KSF73_00945 [Burkholderiaceae bacterium DAT-1]|nr:hypothetical protein [Burkholderiaceae bacterium DAT-1]
MRLSLHESAGLGLIIAHPSGVIYSNQAGGTACRQPEQEGIYIPIRNDISVPDGKLLSPEHELNAYFSTRDTDRLCESDITYLSTALARYRLDHCIQIDLARLNDSMQAWVYVLITQAESQNHSLFNLSSYPQGGVLVWGNGD